MCREATKFNTARRYTFSMPTWLYLLTPSVYYPLGISICFFSIVAMARLQYGAAFVAMMALMVPQLVQSLDIAYCATLNTAATATSM